MQTTAIGHKHSSVADGLDDVTHSPSHGHGLSVCIETVVPHHSSLREDDDHGVRIDRTQQLVPGVISLACDRDDVMGHELEEHSYQRPAGGFLRRRDHAVSRDPPDEMARHSTEKHRLEETGMVEEDDETDVTPRLRRDIPNPLHVGPIEDSADELQESQE